MLEHDRDDRFISQELFSEMDRKVEVDFVTTSDEFFAYLYSHLSAKLPFPSLILINQQAAPLNVTALLKEIKSINAFRYIPVVVLGDRADASFTREYYDAGASGFIQKPATYQDTQKKIETFINYWFGTVELT
jgi:DNA-binding NarL/FixJ family response regulator